MKKIFLFILITLSCVLLTQAQKFKTHTISAGETVESIAKKYSVTPFDIYALNPDAKKSLKPNGVLIIPDPKLINLDQDDSKELLGYDTHKVKRKETLYSISKEYNISTDEIKKHNKHLYSENLRKGEKIRIPKFKTFATKVTPENTLKTYTVLPKEGKWRVAQKFGITVDELEVLNPNMSEVLQPGELIYVPNISKSNEQPIVDGFSSYTVLPKEGYYRLKMKLGLTQGELEELNPELRVSGLQVGMNIRVPSAVLEMTGEEATVPKENVVISDPVQNTDLTETVRNKKTKQLAIMLPFQLNRVSIDSVNKSKDFIQSNKLMSVALEFHSGVLMAIDSAKQLGISSNVKVFDTENKLSQISNILESNKLSGYDAVIGPFLAPNFDRVAKELQRSHTAIFSPLTIPTNLYDNVFQTIPSEDVLFQKVTRFVQSDGLTRQVIIISDDKNRAKSNQLKSIFTGAAQVNTTRTEAGKDAYFINGSHVTAHLKPGRNYVFLETANAGLVMNVTNFLNNVTNKDREVILITTNKTDAFEYEHVSNTYLAKLQFHYPSVNRTLNLDQPIKFVKNYRVLYGQTPSKYAVRGFDMTLDILLRLASEEDLFKSSEGSIETEYVENKFRYTKRASDGYVNEAVYVLKYTTDLTIEESKL